MTDPRDRVTTLCQELVGALPLVHLSFFDGIGVASEALRRINNNVLLTLSWLGDRSRVHPVRDPDILFGAHGRRRRVRHRMRSTAHRGKASAAGPPCPDFSSIRDNPKGTEGTSGWLFKHMLGYAGDRTPTSQTLPEHPH